MDFLFAHCFVYPAAFLCKGNAGYLWSSIIIGLFRNFLLNFPFSRNDD